MSYCLAPYFTVSSGKSLTSIAVGEVRACMKLMQWHTDIFDRLSASFVSIYAKQWMNNLAMNGPDYATLQPNHKSLLRVMFALIILLLRMAGRIRHCACVLYHIPIKSDLQSDIRELCSHINPRFSSTALMS